ncbi:MAG TPA: HXXEE domain-containing protein [Candidatus Methylomirabilis sp.]|nr:HXXEE domain-containing protein [Candidatus Methylomirabilis sp.]
MVSIPQLAVEGTIAEHSFGIAWVLFALALALHVADEARHDFLSTYNPSVRAIRARLPFLPVPTFTFRVWLSLLIAGIVLLLCLSPLAFGGNHVLRLVARVLAIVVGILNAAGHLASSAYLRRWLPGTYSAPILLAAAIYLLAAL